MSTYPPLGAAPTSGKTQPVGDGEPERTPAWRLGRERGFHSPGDYAELAQSDNATPDELETLASSEYVFVRQYVAANQRTPVEVLRSLLPEAATTEHDFEMLRFLCFNPNLPGDLLAAAAKVLMNRVNTTHPDSSLWSVLGVFGHPKAPDALLHELLDAPQATRRFRILAAQRTTRTSILARLAADPSERVRRATHSETAP